jgi:hypothetical protein
MNVRKRGLLRKLGTTGMNSKYFVSVSVNKAAAVDQLIM